MIADDEDEVSEDETRAFLDAKSVPPNCELCGKSPWLFAPHQKVGELSAVAVICGNCGNIRLHLVAAIKRWKSRGN